MNMRDARHMRYAFASIFIKQRGTLYISWAFNARKCAGHLKEFTGRTMRISSTTHVSVMPPAATIEAIAATIISNARQFFTRCSESISIHWRNGARCSHSILFCSMKHSRQFIRTKIRRLKTNIKRTQRREHSNQRNATRFFFLK